MDIKQQFVQVLFDKSVKDKAAKMFQDSFDFNGHKDRMPLELFDISFRLFKATSTYVNLEFLVSSPNGLYFQPVGLFDKGLNIYIINEYVGAFQKLKSFGLITSNAKYLDKKTNAVIAAFSLPTLGHVFQTFQEFSKTGWKSEVRDGIMIPATMRYDKRYECNGYKCELLFCNDGYPQFYLDDEHELEGAIGAYIQKGDGKLSIHPTVEYKVLFDKLSRLKLLTAFTKI